MIQIIYIAGDGRSGSTLLDAILSNIPNSLSVGECHRFWVRYNEGTSHCGCGKSITDCELWGAMALHLEQNVAHYNSLEFEKTVRNIQIFKRFKEIPDFIQSSEGKHFAEVVTKFYQFIASQQEVSVIIDSSKSISWAYMLQQLPDFDVRVIHLERNLEAVANSWKKKIQLPEYTNSVEYMPIKSDKLIIKTWLKIRFLARQLRKGKYIFVSYESFCKNPQKILGQINHFIGANLKLDSLYYKEQHAIGGNPMRVGKNNKIVVQKLGKEYKELNRLQLYGFKIVRKIVNCFRP